MASNEDATADPSLSAYERLRLSNMARNAAVMSQLGLDEMQVAKPVARAPQGKKRARTPREATREPSRRVRNVPVPTYTPGQDEVLRQQEKDADKEEGRRLPDGTWLGERFGECEGVPVGTTFGAGDYQRLGRQEMVQNGFFRPL